MKMDKILNRRGNGLDVETYKELPCCVICKSTSFTRVFKAKDIALTGVFPSSLNEKSIYTPLTLQICNNCSNLQMVESVNKELMFTDYWYRSGTTGSMKVHFEMILDLIKDKTNGNKILDIGCNDCTFLKLAENRGLDPYGFEPSSAYDDRIIESPSRIQNDFFPPLNEWSLKEDKFDIITALSMFYDVDKPQDFLNLCESKLADKGTLIIEVNYAKSFLERKNIDMLGQEHLVYYFLSTFQTLLKDTNLYLNHAATNEMNGGNVILFCSKKEGSSQELNSLLIEEKEFIDNFDFKGFQENVDNDLNDLKTKIESLASENKTLKLYGASTRGSFLVQYLEFNEKHFISAVDIAENKNELYIPGTAIQIEMENVAEEPDYYLILPYQFLDEFLRKNTDFMKRGGKFITYRPNKSIYYYSEGKVKSKLYA